MAQDLTYPFVTALALIVDTVAREIGPLITRAAQEAAAAAAVKAEAA